MSHPTQSFVLLQKNGETSHRGENLLESTRPSTPPSSSQEENKTEVSSPTQPSFDPETRDLATSTSSKTSTQKPEGNRSFKQFTNDDILSAVIMVLNEWNSRPEARTSPSLLNQLAEEVKDRLESKTDATDRETLKLTQGKLTEGQIHDESTKRTEDSREEKKHENLCRKVSAESALALPTPLSQGQAKVEEFLKAQDDDRGKLLLISRRSEHLDRGSIFDRSFVRYAWTKMKPLETSLPILREPKQDDEARKSETVADYGKLSHANATPTLSETLQEESFKIKFAHLKNKGLSSSEVFRRKPYDRVLKVDEATARKSRISSDCKTTTSSSKRVTELGLQKSERNFESNRGSMFEYSFLQYAWTEMKSENLESENTLSTSLPEVTRKILRRKRNADNAAKRLSETIDNRATATHQNDDDGASLLPKSQQESLLKERLQTSKLKDNPEAKRDNEDLRNESLKIALSEPPAGEANRTLQFKTSCSADHSSSSMQEIIDGLQTFREDYESNRGSIFEYSFLRYAWNGAKGKSPKQKDSSTPPSTVALPQNLQRKRRITGEVKESGAINKRATSPGIKNDNDGASLSSKSKGESLFRDWLHALEFEDIVGKTVQPEDLKMEFPSATTSLKAAFCESSHEACEAEDTTKFETSHGVPDSKTASSTQGARLLPVHETIGSEYKPQRRASMFEYSFLRYAWSEAEMKRLKRETSSGLLPITARSKLEMHGECEVDEAIKSGIMGNEKILSLTQTDANVVPTTEKISLPEVQQAALVQVEFKASASSSLSSTVSLCEACSDVDHTATKLETSRGTRLHTIRRNYETKQESMFEYSFIRYMWNDIMKSNNLERKTSTSGPCNIPDQKGKASGIEAKKSEITDNCATATQNNDVSATLSQASQRESLFNSSSPAVHHDAVKREDSRKESPTSSPSIKMDLCELQYKACETDQKSIKFETSHGCEMSSSMQGAATRRNFEPNQESMFEYSFLRYAWNGAKMKNLKRKTSMASLPVVEPCKPLKAQEREANKPKESETAAANDEKLSLTQNDAEFTFMITTISSPEVQEAELVEIECKEASSSSSSESPCVSSQSALESQTNSNYRSGTMLQTIERNFEPNRESMFKYSFLRYAWSSMKLDNMKRKISSLTSPCEILNQDKSRADDKTEKLGTTDTCATVTQNYNDDASAASQEKSQFSTWLLALGLKDSSKVKLENLKKESPALMTSYRPKACEADRKTVKSETSCNADEMLSSIQKADGLQATRRNYVPNRVSMFEYSFCRFAWNGAKLINSEEKLSSASPPTAVPREILCREPEAGPSDHNDDDGRASPLPKLQSLFFDDWLLALGLKDVNVEKFENLIRKPNLSAETQDIIRLNFGPNQRSMFEYSFLQFAWNIGTKLSDSDKEVIVSLPTVAPYKSMSQAFEVDDQVVGSNRETCSEKFPLSSTESNKREQAAFNSNSEDTKFNNSKTVDTLTASSTVEARKLFLRRTRESEETARAPREAAFSARGGMFIITGENDESVSMFDYSFWRRNWVSVNLETLCKRSPQEVLQSLNQLREINENQSGAVLSTQENEGVTLLDGPLPDDRCSSHNLR